MTSGQPGTEAHEKLWDEIIVDWDVENQESTVTLPQIESVRKLNWNIQMTKQKFPAQI